MKMRNRKRDEAATDVAIAATLYYLYRLAGCPLGNNLSGYQAWVRTSIVEPFEKLGEALDR